MDSVQHQTVNDLCGTVIDGKYLVTELLGSGGMGSVYKAVHQILGTAVAIKVLHEKMLSDAGAIARFTREAQLACAVEHPNIVKTFAFGVVDNRQPYIAMELITGEPLSDRLRRIAISPTLTKVIWKQCCDAFGYLNSQGIVHRDIKPSNILLVNEDGNRATVKISDFGIAKVINNDTSAVQRLTQTGQLLGSPQYMSPEQCASQQVDLRSDIYSFGCVVYEMVTGQPPFSADSPFQLMMRHVQEEPMPPSAVPGLTGKGASRIDGIILKALHKNPALRYESFAIFGDALNEVATALEDCNCQVTVNGLSKSNKRVGNIGLLIALTVAAVSVFGLTKLSAPPGQESVHEKSISADLGESPKAVRISALAWINKHCTGWRMLGGELTGAPPGEVLEQCDRFINASMIEQPDHSWRATEDFLPQDVERQLDALKELGDVLILKYRYARQYPRTWKVNLDQWRHYFAIIQGWPLLHSDSKNYELLDRFRFCVDRPIECPNPGYRLDQSDRRGWLHNADLFHPELNEAADRLEMQSWFSRCALQLPLQNDGPGKHSYFLPKATGYKLLALDNRAKAAFLAGDSADAKCLLDELLELSRNDKQWAECVNEKKTYIWDYGTSHNRSWETLKRATDKTVLLLCCTEKNSMVAAADIGKTAWNNDAGAAEASVLWALTGYSALRTGDIVTARTWIGWLDSSLREREQVFKSECSEYDYQTQRAYARFLCRLYEGMIFGIDGKLEDECKDYRDAMALAPLVLPAVLDHPMAAVNAVTLMQAQQRYRKSVRDTQYDSAQAQSGYHKIETFFSQRPQLSERCRAILQQIDP